MGFSGSIAQARAALRELAKVPSRLSRESARRISERLTDMYMSETDPYGRALAPLKPSTIRRKKGNSVILYRTGKEQASARAVPMGGAGIAVMYGDTAEYAHNGAPNRVQRMRVPIYGLPATWRQDLRDVAEAVLGAKGEER